MKFILSRIVLVLKFILCPSSIPLKRISEDQDTFLLEAKRPGLPMIISFAGLGEQFNFRQTLASLDVNVLYLRDLKHQWYLNGLKSVGSNVDETASFIMDHILKLAPSRVIAIGTSAGGFAAILYGSLVNADCIMSFSPQSFVSKTKIVHCMDYRWLDRMIQIYQGDPSNRVFYDLKEINVPPKTDITIYYDPGHRLDRIHAERLRKNRVTLDPHHGAGHDLVKHLRESGKLNEYIMRGLLSNRS